MSSTFDLVKQFDSMRQQQQPQLSSIQSYIPKPKPLAQQVQSGGFGGVVSKLAGAGSGRPTGQNGRLGDGDLVDIGGGHRLSAAAAARYQEMFAAARAQGINFGLSSSYRTYDQQQALYQKYLAGTGNLAAKPGSSNHGAGLSIDAAVSNNPALLSWLRQNAANYGFINDVPSENWHWTYKG